MTNTTTEKVSTLETKIKALNASGVSARLDDINKSLDFINNKNRQL